MRLHRFALATLFTALLAGPAVADKLDTESRFGLGLELGAPTGLNAKYFLGGSVAIQGGIGVMRDHWYYRYHDGLHIHGEVVWHPVVLSKSRSVTIPLHVGVGARLLDLEGFCWNGQDYVRCDNDTHVGVRAPIGVSFLFGKAPMDVFVELALVVDLFHLDNHDYMDEYDRAGLDGVLGARYYF